jgi:sialic acid synthase SpsE
MDVKEVARRGLYSTRAVKRGDKITLDMIATLRPESTVLADKEFDLVGQVLSQDLEAGEPFV